VAEALDRAKEEMTVDRHRLSLSLLRRAPRASAAPRW
jgi:hypothetical protein